MKTADARNQIALHVADWISSSIETAPAGHVPLLFLSGAQGSGKSTALRQVAASLSLPIAIASIDDFYLTRSAREDLALTVSPLLETRGPPGTHDLGLLRATLAALRAAGVSSTTPIPVFDKLADDRAPHGAWRSFAGLPSAIVIEGWLMGAMADAAAPNSPSLNAVEAEDDTGLWRRYQEDALTSSYAALWDEADGFFHILAPEFDAVLGWRLEQEASLWQERGAPMPEDRRAWAARFIQHYERITRRMLAGHRRPGTDLRVDDSRRVLAPPS